MIELKILEYVLMGVLGGVAYVLIAKVWTSEGGVTEAARRLALGAIAGLLVYLGNLPNNLTAFGLGYFAIDAIEGIAARVKPKPTPAE